MNIQLKKFIKTILEKKSIYSNAAETLQFGGAQI